MGPGNVVVYAADPLDIGKMVILSVENGLLLCEAVHANSRGDYYRDLFHPMEVELFEVWEQQAA